MKVDRGPLDLVKLSQKKWVRGVPWRERKKPVRSKLPKDLLKNVPTP